MMHILRSETKLHSYFSRQIISPIESSINLRVIPGGENYRDPLNQEKKTFLNQAKNRDTI